jgi:ribosomal protein S18 acetylase RimI-like enzyme
MGSHNTRIHTAEELWRLFDANSLHDLYDNCFGDANFDPEYGGEHFEIEEVASIFLNYIENGILLLHLDSETSDVIGFAGALPLKEEVGVLDAVKHRLHDSSVYWYHADIGVHSKARGKGVSKLILNEFLELIPSNFVVMRARTDNTTTINLHKKYGFEFLCNEDGNKVTQSVPLKRKSGQMESDERIFLTLKK